MNPSELYSHSPRHIREGAAGPTVAQSFRPAGPAFEQASRNSIISHLFDHLRLAFGVECPYPSLAGESIPRRDIDALLAFKSDSTLEELYRALVRLDNGTYGICISCKHRINQRLLDSDPARQLCHACEKKLSHVDML